MMAPMGRISTSIGLFRSSWAVLRQDRELLVLPVLSGIASVVTVGLFAVPVIVSLDSESGPTPVTYIVSAFAYFVLAFVTIFFNSALVHASNERMSGGDPTVGSALGGATSRIGNILAWALVSATVSQLIRALQERAGFLGKALGFLGGMAWAAVTFLVLPVLVLEDVGVVDAVKRSAALLRNAWGEGLAGNIGMALVGFLALIPLGVLVLIAGLADNAAIGIPLLVIAVLGLVLLVVVMSALSVVYRTALYRFATGLPVPGFDSGVMQGAFTQKR